MDNEKALLIIWDYLLDLKLPKNRKREELIQASRSRWAIRELYFYVRRHGDVPPIVALEMFMKLMDDCASANENNRELYEAARDEVMEVWDIFLAAGDPYSGFLN